MADRRHSTFNGTGAREYKLHVLASALVALSLLGAGTGCASTAKDKSSDTASAATHPSPATGVSGKPSAAPDVTHQPSASERKALIALVKRYYVAMATGDGVTACALLNPTLASAIPEDYGQGPGPPYSRGKTCPVVMSKTFKHFYGGKRLSDVVVTRVVSILLRDTRGAVRLTTKLTPHGEIIVSRQNTATPWRIGSLIGH